MMTRGFYTHSRFRDVFFHATEWKRNDTTIVVYIIWYNWGYVGKPFCLNVYELKEFLLEKWAEFVEVEPIGQPREVSDGDQTENFRDL